MYFPMHIHTISTVKSVLNNHSQKDKNLVFETNYCLMQIKSIAACSKGSILQYFQPSPSYHLSLRSLFCLLLSGCFTQVLLYSIRLPIVHFKGSPVDFTQRQYFSVPENVFLILSNNSDPNEMQHYAHFVWVSTVCPFRSFQYTKV